MTQIIELSRRIKNWPVEEWLETSWPLFFFQRKGELIVRFAIDFSLLRCVEIGEVYSAWRPKEGGGGEYKVRRKSKKKVLSVSQVLFPDLEITFLISTEKKIDRGTQTVKAGITCKGTRALLPAASQSLGIRRSNYLPHFKGGGGGLSSLPSV